MSRAQVAATDLEEGRPLPPYLSTVAQLGLTGTAGMPSLLDAAVGPDGVPANCRQWLHEMLCYPPPPRIALAVQAACRWGGARWGHAAAHPLHMPCSCREVAPPATSHLGSPLAPHPTPCCPAAGRWWAFHPPSWTRAWRRARRWRCCSGARGTATSCASWRVRHGGAAVATHARTEHVEQGNLQDTEAGLNEPVGPAP
jgi:hypothetical protein